MHWFENEGTNFFRSQFTAHGNCLWRKQMRVKWEKGKEKGKTATLDEDVKENVLCILKAVDLHEIKSCLMQHCMTHPYDFTLLTFSISYNEQVQCYPTWTSSLSVWGFRFFFCFFLSLHPPWQIALHLWSQNKIAYDTKFLGANENELVVSSVMSVDTYKSLTGGKDMCKGHLKKHWSYQIEGKCRDKWQRLWRTNQP